MLGTENSVLIVWAALLSCDVQEKQEKVDARTGLQGSPERRQSTR